MTAREDSLDYAIARDKLIDIQVLPDDPIVKSNDNYWNKFKGRKIGTLNISKYVVRF